VPLGVKTTPAFSTRRFRNQFFLGVCPEGQEPTVWTEGELESGTWIAAADAVEAFEAGRMVLAPPVFILLEHLARCTPREALATLRGFSDATFEARPMRIRFSPQVLVLPGKTPTLPPATHTNAYFVGADRLLVVDPATPDPADQKKLLMLAEELIAEGRRIEAIVITHHHHDHHQAATALANATGAPIWAHEITARLLPPAIKIARHLVDGEVIDLGAGGGIRVLHTPGHTPGHICLYQENHGALLAGDMISTVSTIIIDPPEGDLALYFRSLERLLELPATMLYPAHGPPTNRVSAALSGYIAHRRAREQKTIAALTDQPLGLSDLVRVVYDDVPATVHPLAERNLLASLLKLAAEGKAVRSGDRWARAGEGPAS
jgi:ribonuclease/clavin/mitogillin